MSVTESHRNIAGGFAGLDASGLVDGDVLPAHGLLAVNTSVPGGNTVASTASETNFASNHSFAANAFAVGQVYRLTAYGVYSSHASVSTTLRLRAKLGSVVIGDSTAKNNGTGMSKRGWRMDLVFVVTAVGASGTIEAQGSCGMSTTATATGFCDMENTAAITIDTTAAQTLQVSAQHQNSDATNTATLRLLVVERVR